MFLCIQPNNLNQPLMKNSRVLIVAILFLSIFSVSCEKAADANFTYSQNGVGTVYFTNTSSHASSYNWNFGDGSSSTLTSPTHTYSSLGAYTITLTANGSGGNGTNTQTINVQ
jgi:PKD repeat protein